MDSYFYQTSTALYPVKSENSPDNSGRQVITTQAEGRSAVIIYHYAGYEIANVVHALILIYLP